MKKIHSRFKILTVLLFTVISINLSAQSSATPIVRLIINATNFNDETVFYFQQGGTIGFQPAFDAYKLVYNPGAHPYIGSMSDSVLTSISGLPALPVNLSIPVKAITPSCGSFTFSAETTDFPGDVCVTLYDAFTGVSTSILSSEYVCTLYDTTSTARFTIHFSTSVLNVTSLVKQADCKSPDGGMITAKGTNAGPWNYEWKNGDTIIKTCLNKTTADSLTFLKAGNYSLKINNVSGCASFTTDFVVNSVVPSFAAFAPDVLTTQLSNPNGISFKNNSSNASFSSWDFGDKSGTWFIPNPSYNYHSAGVYTVTLITESITHCKDTARQVVKIMGDLTGISSFDSSNDLKLATLSQGNYELHMSFDQPKDLSIRVLDLNGNLLSSMDHTQITNASQLIDLEGFSPGMYVVNVSSGQNNTKTFKVIK